MGAGASWTAILDGSAHVASRQSGCATSPDTLLQVAETLNFGGFIAFLWLALSSDGGTWFHVAEAAVGIVILASARRMTGRRITGSR